VRTPLKAEAPRIVVDCNHVWERSLERSDDGGTITRAVEALAVVVTITSIVQVLRKHMYRRVHLEIKPACVRRQLLIS
jgi:hypothetical protein